MLAFLCRQLFYWLKQDLQSTTYPVRAAPPPARRCRRLRVPEKRIPKKKQTCRRPKKNGCETQPF